IDRSGKEVIPLMYRVADPFRDGLAEVFTGTTTSFMDTKGNEVFSKERLLITGGFAEGLCVIHILGEDKYGFIDKTGKEVIPRKYDDARSFSEGLAAVKLNGEWGFID